MPFSDNKVFFCFHHKRIFSKERAQNQCFFSAIDDDDEIK